MVQHGDVAAVYTTAHLMQSVNTQITQAQIRLIQAIQHVTLFEERSPKCLYSRRTALLRHEVVNNVSCIDTNSLIHEGWRDFNAIV